MSGQFDASASAAARDAAMTQVEEAADDAWKAQALAAVLYVAQLREKFTTDAVWAVLERRGIEGPREPRALGPVMRSAVAKGFCVGTNETSKSVRIDCHRRPLAVWRSRLYTSEGGTKR